MTVRLYSTIFILLLCLAFTACRTQRDTSKKAAFPPPLSHVRDNVGFNEILVKGKLTKEGEHCYFTIEQIIERGRTAPVLSKGQKILLAEVKSAKIKYNQTLKGTLKAKEQMGSNQHRWSFISLNKD